jgi:hypothetical protein
MAKKKSKTEISVSEFKSWISGIEDMQEDDWVPNKAQWDKIKAKIELLTEDVVENTIEQNVLPSYPQQYHQPIQQYQPPMMPTFHASTPMMSDITYTNGDMPEFL